MHQLASIFAVNSRVLFTKHTSSSCIFQPVFGGCVWVLQTPNAGWKMLFMFFAQKTWKTKKKSRQLWKNLAKKLVFWVCTKTCFEKQKLWKHVFSGNKNLQPALRCKLKNSFLAQFSWFFFLFHAFLCKKWEKAQGQRSMTEFGGGVKKSQICMI